MARVAACSGGNPAEMVPLVPKTPMQAAVVVAEAIDITGKPLVQTVMQSMRQPAHSEERSTLCRCATPEFLFPRFPFLTFLCTLSMHRTSIARALLGELSA